MIATLKQFGWHFALSAAILVGAWGLFKYHKDVATLNNQIYLLGSTQSTHLVVSHVVTKTIIQRIENKPVLPTPPQVPVDQIDKVVQVVQSSCPTTTITILKDGTVVSSNPQVQSITVESYSNYGNKLGIRIAYLVYLPSLGHKATGGLAAQVHYWHYVGFYPELTASKDLAGIGLSYHIEKGFMDNTYFSLGYGYHFGYQQFVPYTGVSVKF